MKPKACKVCRTKFVPARAMQSTCSVPCALAFGRAQLERKQSKEAKAAKAGDRAKREALKGVPELKKEAQHAFNAYIRARDRQAGHACICCGKPLSWGVFGGAVDAGHYRSTGSADTLRFNEDNCHAQLAQCNRHGAGRAVDYRLGLIARIGLERVEALEAMNAPAKWQRDELRAIRDTYRTKAAALQRDMKAGA